MDIKCRTLINKYEKTLKGKGNRKVEKDLVFLKESYIC